MVKPRTENIKILAAALLCLAIVLFVADSARSGIHEDALFEMSLGGGASLPSGDFKTYYDTLGAKTGYNMDFSGGYFLTADISIGGAFTYQQFDVEDTTISQKYRLFSVGVYGKYHFADESKVSPYLRAQVGVAVANFTTPLSTPGLAYRENGFGPGLEARFSAGARISTNDWSGFFLEVGYRYANIAGKQTDFKQVTYELPSDVSNIQISGGISFDIGPKD